MYQAALFERLAMSCELERSSFQPIMKYYEMVAEKSLTLSPQEWAFYVHSVVKLPF